MSETLADLPEGRVLVTPLGDGQRRVELAPATPDVYVHRARIDTRYDDVVLRAILAAKGFGFLCDEIAREQDPGYLSRHLIATVEAHVDPAALTGRVLDFGCGAGASTTILARLLPGCELIGLELEPSFVAAARARASFYRLDRVTFRRSPAPDSLPDDLGDFDVIMLSAVFEHLLPDERRTLLPQLWRRLAPGGVLFVDETPWRWFPVETHTTGLPLLNYLPDRAAARLARRSAKLRGRDTWPQLLRAGIRGGTVAEIVECLDAGAGAAVLSPTRRGLDNPVDLWFEGYARGDSGRFVALKRSSRAVLKGVQRTTGVAAVPYLSLAIRKRS